ncbi:MAG TPA: hypothetical protein VMF50_00550 [Candidatus Binataceae bacterium]|nr:hypothetical protein [Candidatus Binataceae bacterium]
MTRRQKALTGASFLAFSFLFQSAPARAELSGMQSSAQINDADTVWVLISSLLVLMMTIPGLALFYGGMVRRKNVLPVLMQSFILVAVVATIAFSFIASIILLKITDALVGLRVDQEAEETGLDLSEHEERAYAFES